MDDQGRNQKQISQRQFLLYQAMQFFFFFNSSVILFQKFQNG